MLLGFLVAFAAYEIVAAEKEREDRIGVNALNGRLYIVSHWIESFYIDLTHQPHQ
jgi:hypothetical protein